MASRQWQGLAWKDLLNNASVSEKEWYLAVPSVRDAEAPTPVQGGDTLRIPQVQHHDAPFSSCCYVYFL